ncbi:MAG: hypothetical protein K8R25_00020 [Methanosarcinales archaeon]|nr:hypothetical protein [Methanosarcinales archaeon]
MMKNRYIRVLIGIMVAFLLLTASLASGATVTVDDSSGANYLSIQAAINNVSAED